MMILLHSLLSSLCAVYIHFRFANHMLHRKYSVAFTFLVLFLSNRLQTYINVTLGLYLVFPQQVFYLACMILTLVFLYEGNPAKKILTAMLSDRIVYISCFFFLPFAVHIDYALALPPGRHFIFLLCDGLSIIAAAAIFEIISRKFRLLRGQMTAGCCLYLLCLSIYLTHSVIYYTDQHLEDNRVSIAAAGLCSVYALAGMAFILLSIYYIDQKLSLTLMEQQSRITARHIRSLKESEKQTAAFRHDIKNHMICLKNLLKDGHADSADHYLESITHALDRLGGGFSTGNVYIDAILEEKYALAQAHSITFTADMLFPATDDMPPMDLVIIVSNALDNALEACQRIQDPAAPRFVRTLSYLRRSYCVIEIENAVADATPPGCGFMKTTKPDTINHGIGLLNIEEAVKRCQGTMELTCANHVFHFCAMLPLSVLTLAPPKA